MKSILEKIIEYKKREVAERKELFPVKLLKKSIFYETPVVSMKKYLTREGASGVIAEFKRKSPSKGDINKYADPSKVTLGYMQAGASALSVITDTKFFGGGSDDLTSARKVNYCPILRKDFIIDEYQIIEARSIGADTILLIAEVLDKQDVAKLSSFAKSLGLEVLLEIHSIEQADKITPDIDILGVNNRDLKTFKVSIQHSLEMIPELPGDIIKISESGIKTPEDVMTLKNVGFFGFLIGERFMKTPDPVKSCRNFITKLNPI